MLTAAQGRVIAFAALQSRQPRLPHHAHVRHSRRLVGDRRLSLRHGCAPPGAMTVLPLPRDPGRSDPGSEAGVQLGARPGDVGE